MISFAELDPTTTFMDQLHHDDPSPVTLVNTFIAPPGMVEEVVSAWETDASIMKAAPGFISAQLYRGTGSSRVLINVAVWESAQALREAFQASAFQSTMALYPDGTVTHPHLVRRLAIPGICTAS